MIDERDLATLEARVEQALSTGDGGGLRVLGYGEITLVLGWPADEPVLACKRLPVFPDRRRLDAYARTLACYLDELQARGVTVAPTELAHVEKADGTIAAYCVQRALPASTLAPSVLADAHLDEGRQVIGRIAELVTRAADARVGFDGQLSNWALVGDELVYFDVSTPMLRDGDGREELDVELFVASLPWASRAAVRRFVLPGILDRYHLARLVLVDLGANLLKERLARFLDAVVAEANGRVEPPLTADEIRTYYATDARTWAALQWVRRADRAWQRRVRRRAYPFLLPPRIER